MIVDPGQDVSKIGLRVEAVQLGRLDQGHRLGEGFATGITACEEPVFPADANRAHRPLGRIVIDGDAAIV